MLFFPSERFYRPFSWLFLLYLSIVKYEKIEGYPSFCQNGIVFNVDEFLYKCYFHKFLHVITKNTSFAFRFFLMVIFKALGYALGEHMHRRKCFSKLQVFKPKIMKHIWWQFENLFLKFLSISCLSVSSCHLSWFPRAMCCDFFIQFFFFFL